MGRGSRYQRKRQASFQRHRRNRMRLRLPQPKHILGYCLIILAILFYTRDAYFFYNGSGGPNWQIGEPQITILTAHNSRPLPELRAFALELVNRDRQLNGLSPLVEDPLLSQAAQAHAQDMLTRQFYAHVNPEGETPTDRFSKIGGKGGVGENIMQWLPNTAGTRSTLAHIERFQKSWMYSDGHRTNLLTPTYTRFGYGFATDQFGLAVYAVQNFAQ